LIENHVKVERQGKAFMNGTASVDKRKEEQIEESGDEADARVEKKKEEELQAKEDEKKKPKVIL
jgi:hypothetical protein